MGHEMGNGDRLIRVDGPRLGHIPSFDGFRGLFILQVVLYHALVTDFLKGSPIVIDWFFVASGFLITSLLLDERNVTGHTNLRTFYKRRALRLFPAMYLMIAVFVVIMLAAVTFIPAARENLGPWWIEAIGAATYSYYVVAAFMPGTLDGALGHTWSLTVEEQFYFIWPLVLLVALRRNRRRSDRNLILGCIAFIAIVMGCRLGFHNMIVVGSAEQNVGGAMRYADEDDVIWQGVVYRLASARPDMIVYGCLLAFFNRAIPRPIPEQFQRWLTVLARASWVLFFLFIALANRLPGFDLFGGPVYQVAMLGLGPIVLDLYLRRDGWMARLLADERLKWLGVRAYGIYLWHVPVLLLFFPLLLETYGMRRLAVGVVAAAAGVLAGVASYRFIERPFLKLKDTRVRRPQDLVDEARAAGDTSKGPTT